MYEIKKFEEKDSKELLSLILNILNRFPVEITKNWIKAYNEEYIINHSKKWLLYVAKKNNKIIGCAGCKNIEIHMCFVDNNFQWKGIGKKLVLYIEWEKNEKMLWLTSSESSKEFYSKLGYIYEKDFIDNAGVKFLNMKKLFS